MSFNKVLKIYIINATEYSLASDELDSKLLSSLQEFNMHLSWNSSCVDAPDKVKIQYTHNVVHIKWTLSITVKWRCAFNSHLLDAFMQFHTAMMQHRQFFKVQYSVIHTAFDQCVSKMNVSYHHLSYIQIFHNNAIMLDFYYRIMFPNVFINSGLQFQDFHIWIWIEKNRL